MSLLRAPAGLLWLLCLLAAAPAAPLVLPAALQAFRFPSFGGHSFLLSSPLLLLIPPAAGSEGMLCSLIDSFTATPAALLGAYPSLPLLGGVRQALLASLGVAVKVRWAAGGCTWVASAGLSSGCADPSV